MLFSLRTIFIGVALLLLAGAGVWYRDDVSRLLSFERTPGRNAPDATGTAPIGTDIASPAPVLSSRSTPTSPTVPAESPVGSRTQSLPAAYTGRDPQEVRPIDDEVRLFTEAQKNKIYQSIRENGSAVKENPGFFTGWIQLGVMKKTIGDFEGARDAWEYASVIQQKNSLSYANLGELYWRYLREYPKSEKNFRTSIANKPEDEATYVSLAELYHYSMPEKYNAAPGALLEGLIAIPENGTLMRRLAYLYEQRKDYAAALEWWRKIAEKNLDDSEVSGKIKILETKLAAP